jgi:hypothetical protein
MASLLASVLIAIPVTIAALYFGYISGLGIHSDGLFMYFEYLLFAPVFGLLFALESFPSISNSPWYWVPAIACEYLYILVAVHVIRVSSNRVVRHLRQLRRAQ